MKTITLKQACSLLDDAEAISLDNVLCCLEHHSYGFIGEPDDDFLTLEWDDGNEYGTYSVRFVREDNKEVRIDKDVMYLISDEGDTEKLYLYIEPENLEKHLGGKKKEMINGCCCRRQQTKNRTPL